MADEADPLILTLAFDEESFGRLDALRRAHFPAHLNRIPAHATLFHHLPGEEEGAVAMTLARACAERAPSAARLAGLMPLGRGVAVRLEAEEVAELRAALAREWDGWLRPQDRQPWRPHVTVQNKVSPEAARDTLARLGAQFVPWEARAEGLLLWRYRGGPWEAAGRFPFTKG
jgi:2'-5' RNA ligase